MFIRMNVSKKDIAKQSSTTLKVTAGRQHRLGKAAKMTNDPSVSLKDIVIIGLSTEIVHTVIVANSSTILTTKVKERADGDKAQNEDGAERKKSTTVGLAATTAAVKVAEDTAAMTATRVRARANALRVPVEGSLLQENKMPHAGTM